MNDLESSSSIFQDGDRWYFWEETGTQFLGPFESESDAQRGLDDYYKYLSTGVYSDFLKSVQWRDGENWQGYFGLDSEETPD